MKSALAFISLEPGIFLKGPKPFKDWLDLFLNKMDGIQWKHS